MVTVSEIAVAGTRNYDFVESGGGGITSFDFRCSRVSSNEVTCPITADPGYEPFDADAELHDGDDSIDMRTTSPSRIQGGPGADVIKGSSSNDEIVGNGDEFWSTLPDGNDWIDGRGGADLMSGGAGFDTVSYASRSTPVNVSLDNAANDGGFGEGDGANGDFEAIEGSQAGDTLTGNDQDNVIVGNAGVDVIKGLGGVDWLRGGDTGDDLDGGPGGDTLDGEAGADTLRGGDNGDVLNGSIGDDSLFGGLGADDLNGNDGVDSVDYAGMTAPLSVTLDGQYNDGAAGESDNVRPDVERVLGAAGNDRISFFGQSTPSEAWGREGNAARDRRQRGRQHPARARRRRHLAHPRRHGHRGRPRLRRRHRRPL